MSDETEPPRQHYGFKDREFKRDNAPVSASAPAPTAEDLAKMAGPPPTKTKSGHQAVPTAKPTDPNGVHALLQHNREVEQRFGGDEIKPTTTRSRRTRDYWLVFGTTELVLGGVVFLGVKQPNAFLLVYGLAGMVIAGIGITWVVWQLMDRY